MIKIVHPNSLPVYMASWELHRRLSLLSAVTVQTPSFRPALRWWALEVEGRLERRTEPTSIPRGVHHNLTHVMITTRIRPFIPGIACGGRNVDPVVQQQSGVQWQVRLEQRRRVQIKIK